MQRQKNKIDLHISKWIDLKIYIKNLEALPTSKPGLTLIPSQAVKPDTSGHDPIHQEAGSHCTNHRSGWGSALPPVFPKQSAQPQQRAHAADMEGNLRAYSSGDQKGIYCLTPLDSYFMRSLLQDQETQPTYLIHGNKHRELGKMRRRRNIFQTIE